VTNGARVSNRPRSTHARTAPRTSAKPHIFALQAPLALRTLYLCDNASGFASHGMTAAAVARSCSLGTCSPRLTARTQNCRCAICARFARIAPAARAIALRAQTLRIVFTASRARAARAAGARGDGGANTFAVKLARA